MNKKKLLTVTSLLLVGLIMTNLTVVASAPYIFSTFDFKFSVDEPFRVYYREAPMSENCGYLSNPHYELVDGYEVDLGNFHAGDNIKMCFVFESFATGTIEIVDELTFEHILGGDLIENWESFIPSTLQPGETVGWYELEISPNPTSDSTQKGKITFARV